MFKHSHMMNMMMNDLFVRSIVIFKCAGYVEIDVYLEKKIFVLVYDIINEDYLPTCKKFHLSWF